MANVGDQRNIFDRRYVAANPNNVTGPLTWNLSDRDISDGNIGGGGADKIPINSGLGLLAEDCIKGQLLYIGAGNELYLARADNIDTSYVVGAAVADGVAGSNMNYTRNSSFDFTDASDIVDQLANLDPGATYYLSPIRAGCYTIAPPATSGAFVIDINGASTTFADGVYNNLATTNASEDGNDDLRVNITVSGGSGDIDAIEPSVRGSNYADGETFEIDGQGVDSQMIVTTADTNRNVIVDVGIATDGAKLAIEIQPPIRL